MKSLLCFATFALVGLAQIQVTMIDGASEVPLTATIDLGSTPIGAPKFTTFVIRNPGPTPVVLSVISLSGQGFTLTSTPSLPVTLPASTGNSRFEVRFLPTATGAYSASLRVNTISTILRSTGAAEARVSAVDSLGIRGTVQIGGRIPAGAAETGTTIRRKFFVENPYTTAVPFRGARVLSGGTVFSLVQPPTQPEIPPGAELEIQVDFSPDRMGVHQASIDVNGRNYLLYGEGLEIPVPRPTLRIDGAATSAQQPKLIVELPQASRTTVSGTLTMDFRPSTSIANDDSGVRFLAGEARRLTVDVKPGDRLGSFGALPEAKFQTGTTAGTILFTLTFGPHKETLSVQIPPAPVKLDTVAAVRRSNDLDLTINAYDNARSVSQVLFTFYDSTGRPVAPGTIRVDLAADFQRYFASSRAGTTFSLNATFPVTGPAAQILEMEAELVNNTGGTKTERIKIR